VAWTAAARAAEAAASLAGLQASQAARAAAIADEAGSGVAARLRVRGGRRIDEDLVVEPGLRRAVDAALGGAGRAYLATRQTILELSGERGLAVIVDATAGDVGPLDAVGVGAGRDADGKAEPAALATFRARLAAAGGGLLTDAIRRDGAARRGASSASRHGRRTSPRRLPSSPTFRRLGAVPRDGSAVVGEVIVRLGGGDGVLEARVELERTLAELRAAEGVAAASEEAATAAAGTAIEARTALDLALATESAATTARRTAEESDRIAARRLEALVREVGWHRAQAERLRGEVDGRRPPSGRGDERSTAAAGRSAMRWSPGKGGLPSCGRGATAWRRGRRDRRRARGRRHRAASRPRSPSTSGSRPPTGRRSSWRAERALAAGRHATVSPMPRCGGGGASGLDGL
jgi:hypothetical protein